MGLRTNSEVGAIIMWELIAIAGILIWAFIAWPASEQFVDEDASAEFIESPLGNSILMAENTPAKTSDAFSTANGNQTSAGGPQYYNYPYPYANPNAYWYPFDPYAYWYPFYSDVYQNPFGAYPPDFRYPARSVPSGVKNKSTNPTAGSPNATTRVTTMSTTQAPSSAPKPSVSVVQIPLQPQTVLSSPQTSTNSASNSTGSNGTIWLPDRSQWPPSASFQPTSVSPGQQYWHLVKALYCDSNDSRNNCPNLPGGGTGTSTYVILIDASGRRVDAPLLSPPGQEQKSSSDMCNCNYTFPDSSTPIQIGGQPSDSISGLVLYSVKTHLSNYHVRYFLTFQPTKK